MGSKNKMQIRNGHMCMHCFLYATYSNQTIPAKKKKKQKLGMVMDGLYGPFFWDFKKNKLEI